MEQTFLSDLEKIYIEIEKRNSNLNGYYKLLEEEHKEASELVEAFLTLTDLPKNRDSIMATLTRVINLREDSLNQILTKEGYSKEEQETKRELAYGFVSTMHIIRHQNLLNWIEKEKLLTPFYRTLLLGVHHIGCAISEFQSYWTNQIINTINPMLLDEFKSEKRVLEFLEENNLLDKDKNGNICDRCYSILFKDENSYKALAYSKAFPNQVKSIVTSLEQTMALLKNEIDDVFNQKEEWLEYFNAIKEAFLEENREKLVSKWANVDRKWMKIKTPIQVGHPLEYYEDHFRKAVALEWDIRIINPALKSKEVQKNILTFFNKMAKELDAKNILETNSKQVEETQLYLGQPMFYYGAEFNGLFSAQVVPNDEIVSKEMGKKIFAFADFVRSAKEAKPIMRLSVEVMGEEFVRKQKAFLKKKEWYEIYNISTIGHEYGHILWIDKDTETKMNSLGNFKNIEEFKATSGGLMAFFENEKKELIENLVDDVISRAVGLIAWMREGEVLPYYSEALIHLNILFNSKIISFNEKIEIDYSAYNK